MANFIATLLKLTDSANYLFLEIHVKSTFILITYSETIFTADDMLNVSVCYDQCFQDVVWRRVKGMTT